MRLFFRVRNFSVFCLCLMGVFLIGPDAYGDDQSALDKPQLRVLGSDSVTHYLNLALAEFKATAGIRTHSVATGTNGGVSLFCTPQSLHSAQFLAAARRLTRADVAACAKHQIALIEYPIGLGGLVLAHSAQTLNTTFSVEHVFLALAKQIATRDGTLVDNPYQRWSDIDPSLTQKPLLILGPARTAAAYDTLMSSIMIPGCKSFYARLKLRIESVDAVCRRIRDDGVFVQTPVGDGPTVSKLKNNTDAFGFISFHSYFRHAKEVKAVQLNGVAPTRASVAERRYPAVRTLYLYVNARHFDHNPHVKGFLRLLASEDFMGTDGILAKGGLIPFAEDLRMIHSSSLLSGAVFEGP